MARPAKTTRISNRTLCTARRALDSWTEKHDNGEFILEPSVYESFATACGVIRCEMSKQHPVKKKKTTLKVEIVNGDEAQEFRRSELAKQKQVEVS
tara:strand:- start:841 stop:1128 length:288 start_codon:yes stop_codon:yes gene_type:complete